MRESPSRRQARSTVRVSGGETQSLIEIATGANAAYMEAVQRGASTTELQALAAAGLEAAERLHDNVETVVEATIQARTSRWRSREKAAAQVQPTLGPRLEATAQAVKDWQERVWRRAAGAALPTGQPPPVTSRATAVDGTIRHVALLADGSGVTFECRAGQWMWRFDPGVPETVTTTALVRAELEKLQGGIYPDDDGRGSGGQEQ